MKSILSILFALLLIVAVSMGNNLENEEFYNMEIADAVYPLCKNGKCPKGSICIDVRDTKICFPNQ
ncbi:hypothetical protein DDB_G0278695 [Dictyostelium discoideum AX4]|uniref:Uncharacterized protein n=1 Tax=Dictyostelium discoideum TaxID=44689 RepID=Q54XY8_DICDI|nr:hypothetical protein DDB_G0278695 [Dictyostelium discoideum AX4]EAL68520.1 hypothetical protein DDB_G0278695 [Dictyostelium discoideum AX4]|eukprot:XP_642414.1 hypothetical protein DDB_G0278695 [Dictyostelium discoideum AX4]